MKKKQLAGLMFAIGLGIALPHAFAQPIDISQPEVTAMNREHLLTERQQAILPIAAFAAIGDLPRLHDALNRGLDSGLTINEIKEVLVQVYAYAGFPRSLNALGEFMRVLQQREAKGINDSVGRAPGTLPAPAQMLDVGTANQTQLAGVPVSGPLYDFAPAVDEYLKTHLFGAIFARDNLDWRDRELTTVGALAALDGVAPQLQAHMGISMNTGLTAPQLRQAVEVLRVQVDPQAAERARSALDQHLSTR